MTKRQLTFVVLDPQSERGKLWQRVLRRSSFEATPPRGGFYHLGLDQFTDDERRCIYETLGERFHDSPDAVRAQMERLGFIPLKDGPDATFGADVRMVS